MKKTVRGSINQSGFTIMELMVVMAVIGILAATAIPSFSVWLPSWRLKTAARELYSNMQLMRLTAVKENTTRSISFSTGTGPAEHSYQFFLSGATKTVTLSDYGSGVKFDDPTHSKTYETSPLTFDSRGTSISGYVYLSNQKNSAYFRISPLASGALSMQTWSGSAWQ